MIAKEREKRKSNKKTKHGLKSPHNHDHYRSAASLNRTASKVLWHLCFHSVDGAGKRRLRHALRKAEECLRETLRELNL